MKLVHSAMLHPRGFQNRTRHKGPSASSETLVPEPQSPPSSFDFAELFSSGHGRQKPPYIGYRRPRFHCERIDATNLPFHRSLVHREVTSLVSFTTTDTVSVS